MDARDRDGIARLGRGPAVALGLLGIVLCIALLIGRSELVRWTASARSDEVSVWLLTPHAAPGDRAVIDVAVYGGVKAGIETIEVEVNGAVHHTKGRGATWGTTLTTRSSDSGSDSEEAIFEVPAGAAPDGMNATVTVTHVIAYTSGGSFSNDHRTNVLSVRIPVGSPSARALGRIRDAGLATGALALAAAALAWRWKRLVALANEPPAGPDARAALSALAVISIALVCLYGYAGHGLFALRIVAATGITGSPFVAALIALWLVAPPVIASRWARRWRPVMSEGHLRALDFEASDGKSGYRAAAAATPGSVAIADVAGALRAIPGARVREKGARLVVTRARKEGPVEIAIADPERVTARGITLSIGDLPLAVEIARALVPLVGPTAFTVDGCTVAIDGKRPTAELVEDLRLGIIRVLMDRVAAQQQALEASLPPGLRRGSPVPPAPAPAGKGAGARSYHPANADIVAHLEGLCDSAGDERRTHPDLGLLLGALAAAADLEEERVYGYGVLTEGEGIVCAAGIGTSHLVLRLAPEDRAAALADGGEPHPAGSEWMRFAARGPGDVKRLGPWCERAGRHARTLG